MEPLWALKRFMVVRLVFFLLAGALVWYGWRFFQRQQARVARSLKDVEGTIGKRTPVKLERDPETGVYRPENQNR